VSSVTYIVTGCMKWIGIQLEWTGEGLEAACSRVVLRVCRFMETWMLVWSLICLVLTAFTCATFVVDTDRFRSVCLSVLNCIVDECFIVIIVVVCFSARLYCVFQKSSHAWLAITWT